MKQILSTLFYFLLVFPAWSVKVGQECFPIKSDQQLVYDEANILSASDRNAMDEMLQNFARSTSNQIVVVIVPDLCGMDPSMFAIELGELWQVGQAKEDNGLVILVKPKTPQSRGEYFIAVGRGLEGAIPDGQTYLIGEREMIPSFKRGDYAGGLNNALKVVMSLAKGEYDMATYAGEQTKKKKGGGVALAFIVVIALLVFMLKAREVRRFGRRNKLGWWAAFWMLNSMGGSNRGWYNDFRGGRGGFGGFGGGGGSGGGGGFGGFGGGSFGGGGSGGSW
jgi:uncharacterized protein